ncbi:MAG: tryptophan synthase subunit alpha [Bacteroidetes bacterium]|nr:tryptophan synthase subunit alpha [Bacteroidota bacterium]
MNRIQQLFNNKSSEILNIYFTAGYPQLNNTASIILNLEKEGVDLIEIGMPYSDPLADGPTIQDSGTAALKNGMNLPLLFEQITEVRQHTQVPLILMGYFNQVMQYGQEKFIKKCVDAGVDGVILPDLPTFEYEIYNKKMFEEADLNISFLITPQTSEARIRKVDELTRGFIYMVSNASITGTKTGISNKQIEYFERIEKMNLKTPRLIGFGISDNKTFSTACKYANGAIIGSAFIRALNKSENLADTIHSFVKKIKVG